MVSQPIDLGQLVVSSGSIVLILFDTLIDFRLNLYHPKGGWSGVVSEYKIKMHTEKNFQSC